MARALTIATAVDQRLRMLDAHAYRERLRLDHDAARVQYLESVARAVADREHHVIGRHMRPVGQHHAADAAMALRAFDIEIVDAAAEAIFAAERLDLLAQAFDDRHQPEGPDVRLGDIQNLFRSAGLDEFGQHLAASVLRVLDLAVQLAVGERAGAALTELHVRFRIEHGLAPQAPGVLGALAHDFAAFQDDRAKARLGKHQRGEEPARPCADHHRPRRRWRRVGPEPIARIGRDCDVAVAFQALEQRRLVLHLDIQRVDQRDRGFLARIDAAPEQRKAEQLGRRDAEPLQQRGFDGTVGARERQLQFGQAQHRRILLNRRDGRLMSYSLYIVRCADGTLYTGIAVDVTRRVMQHNGEKRSGARYTAARRPVRLLYQAKFPTRSAASIEEARIKRLTRAEKQQLIDEGTR